LTFCLAEALTTPGWNLQTIADNFIAWLTNNHWTPRGHVFDVGIATREAIYNLQKGCRPQLAGGFDEAQNGNGSLMRILPLVLFIRNKPILERYQWTNDVSSITHAHIRSIIACFYYLEFAGELIDGKNPLEIYKQLQQTIPIFLRELQINSSEVTLFNQLLNENIWEKSINEIKSSGYVLHSLEASVWCLLTTHSYPEAVLKAVNLGEDTDTTAAITGGLAGILYGRENIPQNWIDNLARKDDILDLSDRLQKSHGSERNHLFLMP
jgi:ADP-ribosylglycohydrolase